MKESTIRKPNDQLRSIREEQGWTQQDLADKIAVTRVTVARWESGNTFPNAYFRRKLCLLLGKSERELGLIKEPSPVEMHAVSPLQDGSSQATLLSISHTHIRSMQEPIQQSRDAVVRALHQEYRRRLEHSLQGTAMIALGLHERTDVIRSSAQLVFRRTGGTAKHPLPPGTSIAQVYDNAGEGLLILGKPGTGKTTLLLDLAHELLTRAERDATHPIPVILNLSSWASKKPPLVTWLIDQLQLVYSVSSRLSQIWLEQNHWLLLLDGLDEVEAGARTACIEAINSYRVEHFVPFVVCSRSDEYLAQEVQLALPSAVVIQPLQEQQVTEYLKRLGKAMAAVRAVLDNDAVLRQLITTPLMLNVIIVTYRGKTVKDLPQPGSPEEHQRQIFEGYIDRMLEQQATKYCFTPQQTRCWLIWLAQHMKQRSLTEFYLEWLQPSWLMTKHMKIMYQLFSCLAVGLPVGLLVGPLIGLFVGLPAGLLGGLLFGSLVGLLVGLSKKKHREEIRPAEVLKWSWNRFWQWLLAGLLVGLLIALLGSLLVALRGGLLTWLSVGLVSGPLSGLLFGLSGGVSGMQVNKDMRTRSNQGIRNSGWNALRFGLLIGLISLLFQVLISWLLAGLLLGLQGSLLGGLLVCLLFGLFGGLGYGRLGVLFLGSLGSLVGSLLGGQPFGLLGGVLGGLFFGPLAGLLVGLPLGGEAYLKHYVLRYLLSQRGAMPWRYVRFLEEATERILLQRVGGGYRFIHPLFLDHFATLERTASPNTVEPSSSQRI